jgi:NCS1 family nucleobase:cation symporter-1
MIAVGLSWKMAIGACVLGNTVMGLVITINGRMGATVGRGLGFKVERSGWG